jgi:hypothetical protein
MQHATEREMVSWFMQKILFKYWVACLTDPYRANVKPTRHVEGKGYKKLHIL